MTRRNPPVRIAGPDPDQIIMPGVRPVTLGEKLQCGADMPMLPRRNQKPRSPLQKSVVRFTRFRPPRHMTLRTPRPHALVAFTRKLLIPWAQNHQFGITKNRYSPR